jgi:putative tryptophan/tyrosine transport system substrate-binding protein
MRRREFVTLLTGVAVGWSFCVHAQQPRKVPRVGVLWHAASAEEESVYLNVVTKAFADLGYVEGKTIHLEHRFPAEQPERFRAFAQEFAESKVDVILAVTDGSAKAAKQATSTIPIVFVGTVDPVGSGLVDNLAHPGGNVTGLSLMAIDVMGKRLGLFKELVPGLSRIAILVDPRDPSAVRYGSGLKKAAPPLGISTELFEVIPPDGIEEALATMERDGFQGMAFAGPSLFNERVRVGAAALRHKMPTLSGNAEMIPDGLLLSYGQDFPDFFRRAVGYVDRILNGARPADLPVEQPTRFKLVINSRVARELGLTIPQSLMVTADEVFE